MRALTLHQPWASLVALGVKTIETRSWSTKYRGPLAIHAGTTQVHTGKFLLLSRIARSGGLISAPAEWCFRSLDVPFGAVVAVCTLGDVVPMVDDRYARNVLDVGHRGEKRMALRLDDSEGAERITDCTGEAPYGDFAPGRFAWLLEDVEPLAEPIPVKGKQRLWEWDGRAAVAV